MRPPKTRREKEIWEACDALYVSFNEANKITGELIFNMLLDLGYKKGSPNEVYRYRKTWLEEKGFDISHASSTLYNTEDPLTRVAKLVRDEIQAEFISEKNRLIDEYEKQLNTMKQAYEDTKSECISFINKNDQLESQLSDLIHTHENLKTDYEQLLTNHHQLKHLLSEEQKKYSDLKHEKESIIAKISDEQKESFIQFQKILFEMKSAFEKDASDYKSLLEKERHEYIVKIDHLQSLCHRLEKDLQSSDQHLSMVQSENALLKNEQLDCYQKIEMLILTMNEQLSLLNGLPMIQSSIIQIGGHLKYFMQSIKVMDEQIRDLLKNRQVNKV